MSIYTTSRKVKVVLLTEIESIGTHEIDEADYLEWLCGTPDTNDQMLDYLTGGCDTFELESDIYEEAKRTGRREIADSKIVAVEAAATTDGARG